MKIEIIQIDFPRAYEKDELFIEFRAELPESQEKKIEVSVLDPFFEKNFAFVTPIEFIVNNKQSYWGLFLISGNTRDPILGLQGGFILVFKDIETSQEIYRKEFKNKGKHWQKRNLSSYDHWDKKRFYLIGDSHSWTNFGESTKNINQVSKYTFIRHAHYGVSSHTFWGGDFMGFIDLLPLEKTDIIGFNFGTYDFRKGIFKASQKNKIPLEECLYSTLFQTFYRLKQLREVYPDNHFIISSVVPPFRETNIKPENREEVFYNSSDMERLRVFNIYKNFWTRHIQLLDNMSFLNWTTPYLDNMGFLIDDYMYWEDTHIEKYEPALKILENHLEIIK